METLYNKISFVDRVWCSWSIYNKMQAAYIDINIGYYKQGWTWDI